MTRRLVVVWAAATVTAMLLVTALALILGGGAPQAPPPGLPDPGRLPAWVDALVPVGTRIAATLAVGFGLIASGAVGRPAGTVRRVASTAAVSWAALVAVQIVVFRWSLDGRVGPFDTTRGRALLVELAIVIAAAGLWRSQQQSLTVAGTVAAFVGLLPSVYAGHVASSDNQVLAAVVIGVHVVAATAWIGGLAALAWIALRRTDPWTTALPTYSTVALAAVIALVASGIAATAQRVGLSELFTSTYGAIVVLKTVALGMLAPAGALQRRHLRTSPRPGRAFIALAGFELLTMAIAAGLATALARTPPPV